MFFSRKPYETLANSFFLFPQYFVALAENYVYGDLELLLKQYPRFVPRALPDFFQTMVVKRIKKKLSGQAMAQGMGRHTRYNSHIRIY